MLLFLFFFFFQAEDGIRDGTVTGVQTCAFRSAARLRTHPVSYLALARPGSRVPASTSLVRARAAPPFAAGTLPPQPCRLDLRRRYRNSSARSESRKSLPRLAHRFRSHTFRRPSRRQVPPRRRRL